MICSRSSGTSMRRSISSPIRRSFIWSRLSTRAARQPKRLGVRDGAGSLSTVLSRLPADAFAANYRVALDCYLEAAEAELLNGRNGEAIALITAAEHSMSSRCWTAAGSVSSKCWSIA